MPPPWSFYHRLRNSSVLPNDIKEWGILGFRAVKILLFGHVFMKYICWFDSTRGASMVPTMPMFGNVLVYSKLHRRGRFVKVGDVVTYKHPIFPNTRGCKRVIGMPGDFVSVVTHARLDENIFEDDDKGDWARVKEEVIRVPEGHCWVQGDNLEWSRDSRLYGPLPLGLIQSKVIAMVLPFGEAKWLDGKRDLVDPVGEEREFVVK